ncbi:MAG: helix-turn-helix domain-containing protein [Candidatus Omnitrophica bacterium]|nr:helix-turn-helix domain-containing protein [Candidatus Omnitrophota bacterium]MDD5690474.1 helix-turn-helix domain-containing protein [Candidatus Omnitrophota bacterium]
MAKNKNPSEKPTAFYIQGIQSGTVRVSSLPVETIEEIVAVLYAEGSSVSQIAQLLNKSDRTVYRYLEEIRRKNALTPSLKQAQEFMGELVQKARSSHSYLMRLARSKDGSISEKTQAEFAAWRIIKELTEKLQSLGLLPLKEQALTGDFFHHFSTSDGQAMCDEIKNSIKDIEVIASQTGGIAPDDQEKIKKIQSEIENFEKGVTQEQEDKNE